MGLPKLVRDLVPEHIENDGRIAVYSVADGFKDMVYLLRDKMDEEVEELLSGPCLEEAADCYEVLRGLVRLHGMRMEDVIKEADRKAVDCGGFDRGFILEAVEEKG